MPELVAGEAGQEEMEKLTEEAKKKEKRRALADWMWEEVRGVTLKTFFLGLKWPGLATFMLQVAPSWVDVGSDWVAGRCGAGCMEYTTSSDIRYCKYLCLAR